MTRRPSASPSPAPLSPPQPSAVAPRHGQLRSLDTALRKMGAQAVLISDLVAARVGLNSSDLECLDLVLLAGPTTAGRLAAHTGLTTGATTAVIDRLERAGFVRRRRTRTDRRVVFVEVINSRARQIAPFYEVLQTLLTRVNARYADHELATISDYLSRVLEAGAEHVAWLEQQPCASRCRRRHATAGESWLESGPVACEPACAPPPAVGRSRTAGPTARAPRRARTLQRKSQ